MPKSTYFAQIGGHPSQSELITGRAVFTESYAVIPKGTLQDIVTSKLPHWDQTRLWILARPLSGFAETFSQYLVEVSPSGGSKYPEPNKDVECVLFVVDGTLTLTIKNVEHTLKPGGYSYIPPAIKWSIINDTNKVAKFHWIRKIWQPADKINPPEVIVTSEQENKPVPMPNTDGQWSTTMFVDPDDLRHDMHVNIVTLTPGAVIPFAETHVMEHGIYILEGKGVYRLNQDWVEVEAGDFIWLRAFCPQACYAGGPNNFRYLLYKDVNRHVNFLKSNIL